MRIALLSNFWYIRGGLERVVMGDAQGLEQRGHEVFPFASAHQLNERAPTAEFFPPNVDHGTLGAGLGLSRRVSEAVRLFHNRRAADHFEAFADAARPDLVHQHGLARQFSPSVLERAKARGLPAILTLHDYSLRCPSGSLSRPGANVCLEVSCAGHRYDRAVRFKCVHSSRAASGVAAAELLAARALRRYERAVDLFLVPSDYVAERMLESGIPSDRLRVMPNSIELGEAPGEADEGYILAFGRLVATKGFDTVVDVALSRPESQFVIAGEGPERAALERRAAGARNIEFTGFVHPDRIARLVRGSRAVVVPSTWAEPFGMVVLESWKQARPVVVARSGALPELVDDGLDGSVFEPADPVAAGRAIDELLSDGELAQRMGRRGREKLEARYSIAPHLDRLEDTYEGLLRH